MAFNPNGARIVSGSAKNIIHVWDALSGEVLLRIEGHEARVTVFL